MQEKKGKTITVILQALWTMLSVLLQRLKNNLAMSRPSYAHCANTEVAAMQCHWKPKVSCNTKHFCGFSLFSFFFFFGANIVIRSKCLEIAAGYYAPKNSNHLHKRNKLSHPTATLKCCFALRKSGKWNLKVVICRFYCSTSKTLRH